MSEKNKVLNNGYIRLVDIMGSDLSIVNAARVSFWKEKNTLEESDEKLIKFLTEHGHYSPFRHAFATIEIKAPLIVARQWFKYRIGSTHSENIDAHDIKSNCNGDDGSFDDPMCSRNEVSRRYVTIEPDFYIPSEWRVAAANKKQGSGGNVEQLLNQNLTEELQHIINIGMKSYDKAIKKGVAPEQARLFLPAYAMNTVWRWSASLQSIAHFLNQRLGEDAQKEIQEYAKAVYEVILPYFPISFKYLIKNI